MSIVLDGTVGITGAVNLTTTGNTILGDASTDTLNVGNGGLVKDASGNVGIGNVSPSVSLDVSSATGIISRRAAATDQYVNIFASGSGQYISSFGGSAGTKPFYILTDTQTPNFILQSNHATAPMQFATNAAERMRIDSSGNVMIGTTTANTYTTGLAVNGQISAQADGISAVSLVNVCRNYNSGSNIFSFALPKAPSSTSTAIIAQTWMINIYCYGDATHAEINTLLVTFYGPTGITVTSLQQQIMGGTSAGITYTRIANAGGDLLQMSGNNYSRIKSVNIVQLGGN